MSCTHSLIHCCARQLGVNKTHAVSKCSLLSSHVLCAACQPATNVPKPQLALQECNLNICCLRGSTLNVPVAATVLYLSFLMGVNASLHCFAKPGEMLCHCAGSSSYPLCLLHGVAALMQEHNRNGMELIASDGNDYHKGKAKDNDQINVVYIVDSDKLPFYRAEQYHQFHNGIGKAFSKEYTVDLKRALTNNRRIGPTGCPEQRF